MDIMKKKIALVYGTRPELIKVIPVIREMERNPLIEPFIINTGQHKEMVRELEEKFSITPTVSLDVMRHNQSLTDIMVNVGQAIQPILQKEQPDVMLVQGDTSTAATVATVCFYSKIPVGHIEAGLRSFNLYEPYPEEFNRKVITLLAKYNFTPTHKASKNLLDEGIAQSAIYEVGNTIVDMVEIVKSLNEDIIPVDENLILITAHRRENHGEGILNICNAMREIIKIKPQIRFIWPLHPNPNVKGVVQEELKNLPNVQLTEPLNYTELMHIMQSCKLIWSDSGGIQEECPSFKKPVLILRNVTERPEVVDSGFGKIVGTDIREIVNSTKEILDDPKVYQQMISGVNPFGTGDAAKKIIEILLTH